MASKVIYNNISIKLILLSTILLSYITVILALHTLPPVVHHRPPVEAGQPVYEPQVDPVPEPVPVPVPEPDGPAAPPVLVHLAPPPSLLIVDRDLAEHPDPVQRGQHDRPVAHPLPVRPDRQLSSVRAHVAPAPQPGPAAARLRPPCLSLLGPAPLLLAPHHRRAVRDVVQHQPAAGRARPPAGQLVAPAVRPDQPVVLAPRWGTLRRAASRLETSQPVEKLVSLP